MAGIINKIKNSVQNTGGNREKIIKIQADKKIRIRFLKEFDKGVEVVMHESFERGIGAICRQHYNEDCPYCEDDDLKTQSKYVWSVWSYDSKEVKLFVWQATSRSPVSQLLSYYEMYGTIMDRDYVIERKGAKLDTTYQVIPMDKDKFRNSKAKPLSESAMMKILDKAYPVEPFKLKGSGDSNDDEDDYDDDDDEEDTMKQRKKKSTQSSNKKKSKKKTYDEDEDDDDLEDEDEDNEIDDEDEEEETPKKKRNNKNKTSTKPIGKSKKEVTDISWIEEKLESEDIDEDEFCDYHEIRSISKLTSKTKKQIVAMMNEYIDNEEDD